MRPTHWATLAVSAFVLVMASCAPATNVTPIPTIALDSTGSSETRNVQASAEVVPVQETRLSFVLSGPIKEVTVQEGDRVTVGQILATLSAPDLEYGILQAEAAVHEAEFNYEYWKLPRRADRTIERRQLAERELETMQRTLDTAHAELNRASLIAPFAATVISVEAQPGEFVQPGQAVIVLAKLDDLQIETTDLSELDIAAVKIGQSATAHVEALNKDVQGVVTAISPISETIGGDVVYRVTIKLDDQPSELLWGMSADVEIQTEP